MKSGSKRKEVFAVYDLKKMFESAKYVNIAAVYAGDHIYGLIPAPILHVDRKLSGKLMSMLVI